MANHFFLLGLLGAIGWALVEGAPPAKPAPPLVSSRLDSVRVNAIPAGRSPPLEARQAPVPLVRNVGAAPALSPPSTANDSATTAPERQGQDDPDRNAAKAAAELDGYKRVTIVGRTNTGAWRAKAYRGPTEVLLTVDGTGRVSVD